MSRGALPWPALHRPPRASVHPDSDSGQIRRPAPAPSQSARSRRKARACSSRARHPRSRALRCECRAAHLAAACALNCGSISNAVDMRAALCEQRRHITAARTHFEHPVDALTASSCSMRASSLGASIFSPAVACSARVFPCRRMQGCRYCSARLLASHGKQQIKHFLVKHLPGTDLLLDHVEAGAFDVDRAFMTMRDRDSTRG